MPSVLLIGPMGAGKTTIGRQLAARLRMAFVDLDDLIVRQAGKSIPRIFEEDGECVFRAMEGEALQQLCDNGDGQIVATGGGIVMAVPNRERLRACGVVVWLDVAPEVSAQRIGGDRNRPLLNGVNPLQKARELDHVRRQKYDSCADVRIDTGVMSAEEAVDAICRYLSEYGHAT